MAEGEDSRPFLVLKQNAEDFKAVFDKDVKTLLDTLDSRITDLLRNPESLANSAGGEAKRLNAHMEFSKAKLDIFVTLKDKVVEVTDQWMDHLSEIRDTFVENVEIFLAGTKLEVKEGFSSPAGSKKSLSLKERKKLQSSPIASSLYPKLLDTAKSIPVLNNLLPKTNHQDSFSEPHDVGSSPLLKPIRKPSALPELDTSGPGRRKNSVRFAEEENTENIEMVEEEETSDSEVEIVEAVMKKRRGRTSALNSSAAQTSLRKAIVIRALQNEVLEAEEKLIEEAVESPSRGGRGSRRGSATPSSAKKATTPVVQPKNKLETSSDSSISGEEASAAVSKPRTRRGAQVKADEPITPRSIGKAKRGSKMSVTEEVSVITPVKETPGRRGRRAAAPEPVLIVTPPKAAKASPNTKNFPHGLDLTEDLDIFSPVVNLTRSAPRRKTVILQDLGFTPEVPKSKSKRKTIGGDLSSGTPSKRLKMSGRNSLAPQEVQESDDSDHLEGENTTATGNYTPWVPLSDIGAGVPTEPGIYELKVSQAKKSAYIGGCESLRQKLTLHRLRHASGHKHLDKFVERNAANLLVRYERVESLATAKALEKARVAEFTAVHNTTPAYN